MIRTFYVVTVTSLYRVSFTNGVPVVAKIALKGESQITVGSSLHGGNMVAITSCVVMYNYAKIKSEIPFAPSRIERRIELIDRRFWGGHTSKIVGLFITRNEAMAAFAENNLMPCDSRFETQTLSVCEAICEIHPRFYVCKTTGLCLSFFSNVK